MHHVTDMNLFSSQSQALWSQAPWAHNLWSWCCASFRHSAGFHARVVLDSDGFRLGVLGEVVDAKGVLGVDRVVQIVVRVLGRGGRKSE